MPAEFPQVKHAKHPPVARINDLFTFKMNRFVQINEREGQRWAKRLFDLSLNEWRLLGLVNAGAPVRAGDVAEQMLMDKSQFSRLMKVLNARNLITGAPDRDDARAIVLSPTHAGRSLYREIMIEVLRQNEKVLAPLSMAEVAHFNEMLDRLTHHSVKLLAEVSD